MVGAQGDLVYLHAWDDYQHHALTLRAHRHAGIARTHLRAASPEALRDRVSALEAAGHGRGWTDGEPGFGPTAATAPKMPATEVMWKSRS